MDSLPKDNVYAPSDTDMGSSCLCPSQKMPPPTVFDFDGPMDPLRPTNWSPLRRWAIVVSTAVMTFVVSFSSAAWSATLPRAAPDFDTSPAVVLIGVSLFVLGFGVGPQIFGPASELYGRTRPLWLGMWAFCALQVPLGMVANVEGALVLRFLAGTAGSAPFSIVTGLYVDILSPPEMGVSMAIFTVSVYAGPVLGPLVGSYITEEWGWRWTVWVTFIAGVVTTTVAMLLTPETYAPVVLRREAARLRVANKDWGLHAACEEEQIGWDVFVVKYMTRPIKMFVREPILIICTVYMSFTYGLLYLTFVMYPFAFVTERGWSATTGSLPFLSLMVGILIACLIISLHSMYYVKPRIAKTHTVNPEDRLPPMILGAVLLPAGLFWFAWTSSPTSPWLPQVLSGVVLGCAIILVFMLALAYLIDVYMVYANSALAINVLIRSVSAAAFPFIGTIMFERLGTQWGGSVLGFISVALVPFPVLGMIYGKQVRGWSRYAMKVTT